jgi:hypothetical protein
MIPPEAKRFEILEWIRLMSPESHSLLLGLLSGTMMQTPEANFWEILAAIKDGLAPEGRTE